MKKLLLLSLAALLLSSCNNYKMEDLYGSWTSTDVEFTFNADKTMSCRIGTLNTDGRYRPFGNTLELVNSEELVFSRVTIKSLKNDSLVVDMPNVRPNVLTLTRKK